MSKTVSVDKSKNVPEAESIVSKSENLAKENEKVDKKTEKEIIKEEFMKISKESESLDKDWRESIKSADLIDETEYFQMKHYIRMVISGDEFGTIIKSRGGTGKTTTTLNYLTTENVEFAYMNSFSTPVAFYIWLYKNRNKIKVIDDVHKLLESEKFAPFLKAILEGYNGERIVFYNTSKPIEDNEGVYPPRFKELGGTIILTNRINDKNIHIDAILSRVPLCELNISNTRMLELMACIAQKPYKNLSVSENMEVYEYCKETLVDSLDLNLRTFNHARNFYNYAKNQSNVNDSEKSKLWKRLINLSLKKDDTDLIIMSVLAENEAKSNDELLKIVNEKLVKPISRATFYRKKDELKKMVKKMN